MKTVTVYMGPMCSYCDAAKMLKKSNGRRTIPQIFFDDHHVGGFEELRSLEKNGDLLNLLK